MQRASKLSEINGKEIEDNGRCVIASSLRGIRGYKPSIIYEEEMISEDSGELYASPLRGIRISKPHVQRRELRASPLRGIRNQQSRCTGACATRVRA